MKKGLIESRGPCLLDQGTCPVRETTKGLQYGGKGEGEGLYERESKGILLEVLGRGSSGRNTSEKVEHRPNRCRKTY